MKELTGSLLACNMTLKGLGEGLKQGASSLLDWKRQEVMAFVHR